MIKLTKQGRPNKAEKGLLKNINDWISNLSDEEKSKHDFIGKSVNNKTELESIWEGIIGKKEESPIEETKVAPIEKTKKMAETQNIEDVEIESSQTVTEPTAPKEGGIPNFFSPLAEEVKQREYNKITPQNVTGDIPEPTFEGGMGVEDDNNAENEVTEEATPSPFENVTNDKVNQLEGKEKKIACEQLVDTVLDLYEMGHGFGVKFASVDENQLMEKAMKGEIDPTMEIPIDDKGTTTNPMEFFQTYNSQVEEVLTYDPEFGEKVKPAMRRVFEKKGWGFTDEQFLMYMFGKDMGMKTMMVVGLKKQSSMMMNTFVEMQQQKLEALARTQPPVNPDSITRPPQPTSSESTVNEESTTEAEEIQAEDVEAELGGE